MSQVRNPRGRGWPVLGSLLALAASGLVTIGVAPQAGAAGAPRCVGDPPALTTLTLSRDAVDVTAKARKISVAGTTGGAALTGAWLSADTRQGSGDYHSFYRPLSVKKRSFSGSLTVPKGVLDGTYEVGLVLSGKNGKEARYSYEDLAGRVGVDASFDVVSRPDKASPTVSAVAVSKTSVNTTKKAAKVTVTATIKDKGGSGAKGAGVEFRAGGSDRWYYANLKKKEGSTFSGALTVRRWAGNTKLTVSAIDAFDGAGNTRTYYARDARISELHRGPEGTAGVEAGRGIRSRYDSSSLPRRFKKSIKVTSKSDTQPPKLTSATATQKTFKLTYKAKATDDKSGVGWVSAFISGMGPEIAGADLVKKGKTWKGTARIPCDAPSGTYLVRFELWDKAGNWVETSTGKIQVQ